MTTKTTTKSLEKAMQELEALVTRMESGELSLDDSLAAFEQGIALSKQCQQALQQAEQRVSVLLGKTTEAPLSDFASPADDNDTSDASNDKSSNDFDDNLPF